MRRLQPVTPAAAAARAVGADTGEAWVRVAFSAVEHSPSFPAVRERFEQAWTSLVSETWLPLYHRLVALPVRVDDARLADSRLVYLARLLECVLWWAIDADAEPDRLDVVQAEARRLATIDGGILHAARHLEQLLRSRHAIERRGVVHAGWRLPSESSDSSPSAWLLDVLAAAARRPEFADWASGACRQALDRFMVEARTQYGRRSPTLADVLSEIAHATPSRPEACHVEDAALLVKGQGRRPDPWATLRAALFAAVLAAWGRGPHSWEQVRGVLVGAGPGPDDGPGQALEKLLMVAAGRADRPNTPTALSASAVRKAAYQFDPAMVDHKVSAPVPWALMDPDDAARLRADSLPATDLE